jgi:hypothetical protein
MFMKKLFLVRLALIAMAFGGCLSMRAVMWDDFVSYPEAFQITQGVPPGPNSPWGRFGAATDDNLIADYVGVGGSIGGDYPLRWSQGNNGNLIYYFPTVTNLSVPAGFRVQLRIDAVTPVPTQVVGAFQETNGNVWGTIQALKPVLTNTTLQMFAFQFTPAQTERLDGVATNAFSLTDVINVRIRFENSGGNGTNHIYVDNFESLPLPPVITQITRGPGDAVRVTFTCQDGVASDFVLERATTLGPSTLWEPDPNAIVQGIDATTFQADTVTADTAQFYRVSH